MKYAELKADNERLRTQLADLVNAVETLRVELLSEAKTTADTSRAYDRAQAFLECSNFAGRDS
jgi:hypothetical protein